jgi:hypothetical protein
MTKIDHPLKCPDDEAFRQFQLDRIAAAQRHDAEQAHQWEEADDLTLARAEVLSLVGLLAELDRMEQENKDDALGGYCGAKVADFKRRYREAITRNGGVAASDGAQP